MVDEEREREAEKDKKDISIMTMDEGKEDKSVCPPSSLNIPHSHSSIGWCEKNPGEAVPRPPRLDHSHFPGSAKQCVPETRYRTIQRAASVCCDLGIRTFVESALSSLHHPILALATLVHSHS